MLQSLLTEARKTGGMTQAELAAALGVSGADLLVRLAHGTEKSPPDAENTTGRDE
ncbi:hypothetical protein predicted by Glimmer/Critica [Acetobacter senegalensis]|uniref:Transcriptional regulator n=1 Tax=Acetobacter senegalensis TaxID=446692 RepID=A0A0U5EU96_9PROT|nr:hypothetical protein predicted by Glimmer/Critica [Acetobacter senegalensis]